MLLHYVEQLQESCNSIFISLISQTNQKKRRLSSSHTAKKRKTTSFSVYKDSTVGAASSKVTQFEDKFTNTEETIITPEHRSLEADLCSGNMFYRQHINSLPCMLEVSNITDTNIVTRFVFIS